MKKHVRTILQTTLILLLTGIFVKVNAQPVRVTEIAEISSIFTTSDNFVYYFSRDSVFRTDGTAEGTIFLKNGFFPTNRLYHTTLNGRFYFINGWDEELWSSDGTPAGTVILKTSSERDMKLVATTADYVYFSASSPESGHELYRTDGTLSGTVIVRDINPGAADGFVGGGAAVGNVVFFAADNGTQGRELWTTSGTAAGTSIVKDINAGEGDGFHHHPWWYHSVFSDNGLFYFTGFTAGTGSEPWVSDGTADGTTMLVDIVPGPLSRDNIDFKIALNAEVYFLTNGDNSTSEPAELWKTSGSPSTTVKLKDLGPDITMDNYFRVFADRVHFFTKSERTSTESSLWSTDGTSAGTNSYFTFLSDSSNNYLTFLDVVNDHLLFTGAPSSFEVPFYRTDGTTSGSVAFTHFNFRDRANAPHLNFMKAGDYVFYSDHEGFLHPTRNTESFEDWYQLFRTDGFSTESIRTLYGVSTTATMETAELDGQLLFTTHDPRFKAKDKQHYLWTLDPESPTRPNPSFTLIDAGTDEDVRRIIEGSSIDIPDDVDVNIRFNPLQTPGSVVFKINDVTVRTETAPPYSLAGDVEGDYAPWQGAQPGTYKLTATPYSESGGRGTPGESLTVNFTLKNEDEPQEENCSASGTVLREYWDNVSGNSVSSIPVGTAPTSSSHLTIFEGPTNADTNYGARIRGYICPPTTGSYTFWISSNDNSELWLSTDDNPSNRRRIAFVTGATNPREWTKYPSQKSAAIALTAGKRYYIEALHKQGVGTDNLAVGWQLPDGTLERPIPGNRLSPFDQSQNSNPQVYISAPGNTYDFAAPADVPINANANDADGTITVVEFFLGSEKIGEDREAREEEIYDATLSDLGPGTYTITAKATDNTGATTVSEPVTFTVTDYSCDGSGTITRYYWRNVSGDRVSDVPDGSWIQYQDELTTFEGPTNFGDNYATRIRGYICIPQTGGYKFWIASNDHSELWLSTDHDPANKVRIAWVTGATNPRQWTKYPSQVSTTIMLQQGKRYYIEAVHKEAVGTDHIAVGWTLPNGELERPIPGNRLIPFDMNAARIASPDESILVREISVFPNPTTSGNPQLMISGFDGLKEMIETEIEIVNMTGEVVFAEKIACGGDCSSYLMKLRKQLVPGIYLINIRTSAANTSKRLLVK